jgi:preprotein translocase subunit SecA
VEYKKESFQLFEAMKEAIEEQMLQYLYRFEVVPQSAAPRRERPEGEEALAAPEGSAASRRAAADLEKKAKQRERDLTYQGSFDPTSGGDFSVETVKSAGPKVGRNDPCPCGSGKKYKKCHGAHAPEPVGIR